MKTYYILTQTIERETIVLEICSSYDEAFIEMQNIFLKTLKERNISDENGNEITEVFPDVFGDEYGFESHSCWLNNNENFDWKIHKILI